MDEYNDLQFTDNAKSSLISFYDGLNEINIFVEDINSQFFYETIFERLLGNHFHVYEIFPRKGKQGVIDSFKERGAFYNGTPNFYLVDGDFDRYIKQDKMTVAKCFVYLKAYNIENYIIDEQACIATAKAIIKKRESEVKKILKYNEWKSRIVDQAKKLFLSYCYYQKYQQGIKNVARSSFQFIDSKTGFERTDSEYVDFYQKTINTYPDALQRIRELQDIYESINGTDYYNLICGKFLLDSWYTYLGNFSYDNAHKKKKPIPVQKDYFKHELAANFDVHSLDYVKDVIVELCNHD